MGRKKLGGIVKVVQIKLSLRSPKDDDLINFFDSIPSSKKAQRVKSALRGGNISVEEVPEENLDELMEDLFF